MSALMKEMLIDYVDNKVSLETRYDIDTALIQLPPFRKRLLLLYACGFTVDELSQAADRTPEHINAMLTISIEDVATMLRVSDNQLIVRAKQTYPWSKMDDFARYLKHHAQNH